MDRPLFVHKKGVLFLKKGEGTIRTCILLNSVVRQYDTCERMSDSNTGMYCYNRCRGNIVQVKKRTGKFFVFIWFHVVFKNRSSASYTKCRRSCS